VVSIKGDGNCGFRSLSYALTGSQKNHEKIRLDIINYLEQTITRFNQGIPGNDWWSKLNFFKILFLYIIII
jgi:hypothetical protein